MQYKWYMRQIGETKTGYLTRAAQIVDSIDHGISMSDGRNLKDELTDDMKKEIKSSIFDVLLNDVRIEALRRSKRDELEDYEREDFISIMYQVTVEEFFKFNNPLYMNKQVQCTIGTYLSKLSPRAMRIYLCESRNLPVNAIRNMREIEKAIVAISKTNEIVRESVTAEMIFDYFTDKSISLELISLLMEMLKGNESYDVVFEDNDSSFDEEGFEEILEELNNLSPKARFILDKHFDKLSKAEMYLFMKVFGMLGESAMEMDIADFVNTSVYQKLFMEEKSSRSKSDPVKSGYNKKAKIDRMMAKIAKAFEEENVEIDDVLGCLEDYCMAKWTEKNR